MVVSESALGRPDIAVFQSWNAWPLKLLPDSDEDAYTSIINRYVGMRTRLSVTIVGNRRIGRVTSDHGRQIADVPIKCELRYRSPLGKIATLNVSGQAPATANGADLAIRINTHDDLPGSATLGISKLTVKHADETASAWAKV